MAKGMKPKPAFGGKAAKPMMGAAKSKMKPAKGKSMKGGKGC